MDEDIARIELRRKDKPSLWAVVDLADLERVLRYRWCSIKIRQRTYAQTTIRRNGGKTHIYLHRYILDAPAGALVDHVDHDGLNNRRSNLRLATPTGNVRNARLRSDNPSGYKGVAQTPSGRWRARIVVKGKRIWLGTHATAEEAARAYDAAARERFGQFACVNFPREDAAA